MPAIKTSHFPTNISKNFPKFSEKLLCLGKKQQLFLIFYTKIGHEAYFNPTVSAKCAGYSAKSCDEKGRELICQSGIRQAVIVWKKEATQIGIEQNLKKAANLAGPKSKNSEIDTKWIVDKLLDTLNLAKLTCDAKTQVAVLNALKDYTGGFAANNVQNIHIQSAIQVQAAVQHSMQLDRLSMDERQQLKALLAKCVPTPAIPDALALPEQTGESPKIEEKEEKKEYT